MPINQLRDTAAAVVQQLRKTYPDAVCSLVHDQPWQLLVAAILSAQCTDARVNVITPDLFARFPTLREMAAAEINEIETIIRSCGLYRSKAKSIQGSARLIVDRFAGKVPDQLHDLLSLPGVGRKIANLILGDAFGKPAIVVDTHCARLSKRIGLTDHDNPVHIEKDLINVLPQETWIDYGHLMVEHGRAVCDARRPACDRCPIAALCRYAGNRHRDEDKQ